jgi:hypothetical protein
MLSFSESATALLDLASTRHSPDSSLSREIWEAGASTAEQVHTRLVRKTCIAVLATSPPSERQRWAIDSEESIPATTVATFPALCCWLPDSPEVAAFGVASVDCFGFPLFSE